MDVVDIPPEAFEAIYAETGLIPRAVDFFPDAVDAACCALGAFCVVYAPQMMKTGRGEWSEILAQAGITSFGGEEDPMSFMRGFDSALGATQGAPADEDSDYRPSAYEHGCKVGSYIRKLVKGF